MIYGLPPDHDNSIPLSSGRFPRLSLGTLERRVFLVAVASLMPVAILSCVLFVASAREQQERLYRGSEDTIFALLSAVDAELKNSIASLDALSVSPRLASGDFDGLRAEAQELLERRPEWLNIVVADDEHQLMNARLPPGDPLPPIAAPEMVAATLRSHRPVIGNVMVAPVLNTQAFAVQIPYERAGHAPLVLTAVIRPDSLLNLFDLENLSTRGVISILDRNDHIVARTRDHAAWVGKPPSAELVALIRTARSRGITHTLEGIQVYTVFRRSSYSGWAIAMGIRKQTIDGPLQRSYFMLGGTIILSILLGLAAALFVGRGIVRPMRELEASAARVGRGEAPTMPRTRLAEVRRVAVALDGAYAGRESAIAQEREARLAAEGASKAKDEFLAMLGHELRNPLAAIVNASQLIEHRRHELAPGFATATDIIARQARHLARMTDDLLDAGRVILGKISLLRAPLDLAAAVANTLDGLRTTGRVGDLALDVSLEPVWIFADATRIDQIIGNLLTNALKYTPAGGRISLRTRRAGAQAEFVVADTGIGLEPELLPRAFDLFVQGARGLDRSQGGLGIGLTLVRRLTELHGGTVEAESAGSGQGARFTVRLPAVDAPAVDKVAGTETGARVKHGVAIVEDNDDARLSLALLLELEGHEVHVAGDGTAGVALIAGNPRITVAFIDIGLPGMSGYEIARAVRMLRGNSVRLVAMSGYGAEQDVARGVDAGFDAYIVKPADISALRPEIAKA